MVTLCRYLLRALLIRGSEVRLLPGDQPPKSSRTVPFFSWPVHARARRAGSRARATALHHSERVPGRSYVRAQGRSSMARGKVKTYKEQKFDLKGLDGISDKQVEEHLALYAGYVKQVNTLNEELAKLRSE